MPRKKPYKRHTWDDPRSQKVPAWPEDTEYMISVALTLKKHEKMSENDKCSNS